MDEAFVIRDVVKLSCKGSHVLVHAAEKHAAKMGLPVCIAVVDEGGNLLAFSRMDGARVASVEISQTKARSAARRLRPTSEDGGATFESKAMVAMMSGLAVTAVPGGLPIVVEGKVIGGIGVSSAASHEDVEIAEAAIAAFLAG